MHDIERAARDLGIERGRQIIPPIGRCAGRFGTVVTIQRRNEVNHVGVSFSNGDFEWVPFSDAARPDCAQ